MLHPRTSCWVGATDKPGNYAERIWNNLVKYQYKGKLFPVNAKREHDLGRGPATRISPACRRNPITCWCGPARFAVQVIRDAAAAGAPLRHHRHSGFSELQDAESQRLAVELKEAVRETGLAVTGPNCLGNLSAGENLFTNIDDRIVTMEAGPVAIAGQSGAIVMRSAKRWKIAASASLHGHDRQRDRARDAGSDGLFRGRSLDPRHRGLISKACGTPKCSARPARPPAPPANLSSRSSSALPKAAAPPRWRTPEHSRALFKP